MSSSAYQLGEYFQIATVADATGIAALVNLAYRPAPGAAGWTHESGLVAGQRIDVDQVLKIIKLPDSVILLAVGALRFEGCVHLQKRGNVCLLGLLAVYPDQQGIGLGKRLLTYAEGFARESWSCSVMRISVISQRRELLAYYERCGYRVTGSVMEYPLDSGIGLPVVDGLTVATLEKPVACESLP